MTTQKSYHHVRLGEGNKHAKECYEGKFIGVHGSSSDGFDVDLSKNIPENQKIFNKKFSDIFLKHNPDEKPNAAINACKAIWAIRKKVKKGDIVLCPKGDKEYWVGEVISDYLYQADSCFPHQRKVKWLLPTIITYSNMSSGLQKSTGSTTPIISIQKHAEEIERFISGDSQPKLTMTDESTEDASEFALEKHLEDFLVKNWASTELGEKYDIYENGQQYQTYTGFIDILAISKDKKEFLVVELKKGLVSDNVIGQILKYITDIKEDLANSEQKVRGAIIAFGNDKHFNRARSATNNIDFYEYKVNFSLSKK